MNTYKVNYKPVAEKFVNPETNEVHMIERITPKTKSVKANSRQEAIGKVMHLADCEKVYSVYHN